MDLRQFAAIAHFSWGTYVGTLYQHTRTVDGGALTERSSHGAPAWTHERMGNTRSELDTSHASQDSGRCCRARGGGQVRQGLLRVRLAWSQQPAIPTARFAATSTFSLSKGLRKP